MEGRRDFGFAAPTHASRSTPPVLYADDCGQHCRRGYLSAWNHATRPPGQKLDPDHEIDTVKLGRRVGHAAAPCWGKTHIADRPLRLSLPSPALRADRVVLPGTRSIELKGGNPYLCKNSSISPSDTVSRTLPQQALNHDISFAASYSRMYGVGRAHRRERLILLQTLARSYDGVCSSAATGRTARGAPSTARTRCNASHCCALGVAFCTRSSARSLSSSVSSPFRSAAVFSKAGSVAMDRCGS